MFRLLVIVLCLASTHAFAQDDDAALLEDSSAPQSDSVEEAAPAPTPAPTKKMKRKKTRRTKSTSSSRGPKRSIYYNVAAGYSMGGDIKFSKVEVESTVVPGFSTSATYKTDAAIELSGGFMNMGIRSWGYGANLAYQMARKIKSVTVAGNTVSSSASISTIIVAGYGIYRWVHWYLPFGLNFTLPSYSKGSGEAGSTKVKGDFGPEVGVGYLPRTTGLFFEGFIKFIGIQAQTDVATETYTFKTAYLLSPTIKVGYRF